VLEHSSDNQRPVEHCLVEVHPWYAEDRQSLLERLEAQLRIACRSLLQRNSASRNFCIGD
jgi:hypothetical protein